MIKKPTSNKINVKKLRKIALSRGWNYYKRPGKQYRLGKYWFIRTWILRFEKNYEIIKCVAYEHNDGGGSFTTEVDFMNSPVLAIRPIK